MLPDVVTVPGYAPDWTRTAVRPATDAAPMADWIVFFGSAEVRPELASSPLGATKTDAARSPSIPSQFASTKTRSGASAAPGWGIGALGAQSVGARYPS